MSKQVYLDRLFELLSELYNKMLVNKKRADSPKIEGFIEAGLCAGVVSKEEVEEVINRAHTSVFGVAFTSQLRPSDVSSEVLDIPTYMRDRKSL